LLTVTIKTDQPEAELGLFDNNKQLGYVKWPAHRELAETIHSQLFGLLKKAGKDINQVGSIICFQGPGSYTGLRIGLSVANALSYSLKIPVAACRGENWVKTGLERLNNHQNDSIAIPFYGGEIYVTLPKH
jgi:tRNA threonylcarbamoyladenosine biosynthesis protein TsaB